MERHFDWDDLTRELDLWAEAGRVVALWWRDDDAVEPTPALTRLLDLTDAFRVELGLAVIPAAATPDLAAELADRRHVAVLQHGYRHRNHAPAGEPAVECGGARPVDEVLAEMRAGQDSMRTLFPGGGEPILAAPWNRIARPVLDRLAEAGYRGASAMGPRALMAGAPGLVVANAHVDPLNWKTGGGFAGLGKALSGIIGELKARRSGASEADEPLGILTHHLVHDDDTWAFLPRFLELTSAHPASRWVGARDVFGLGEPQPAMAAARS
jgi:peptidoglycan/xylan/chitin deacetylase (PgdA/CDA1 family)